MTERSRALAAFDAEYDIAPNVAISAVRIPFWDLVNFILKLYLATIVASAIIGAVLGVGALVFMLITR